MLGKRTCLGMLTLLLLAAGTPVARGAALDTAQVPAEAKWVLHLDADAVRGSALWKQAEPALEQNARYGEIVRFAQALAGMELPRDLHGVTLYGTAFGEAAAVVIVHADYDQARLRDMLELSGEVGSSPHGNHTIHNWNDPKGRQYGTFASPQMIVVAREEANVKQALDVLGNAAAGLKDNSALAAARRRADVMLYLAGIDLASLARAGNARSPLAGNVEQAWISISSGDDALHIRGAMTATAADTAQQLRQAVEGLKALALLSANSEKLNEAQKAAAQAVSELTAQVQGQVVEVDWAVPMTVVRPLLEQALDRAAARRGSD